MTLRPYQHKNVGRFLKNCVHNNIRRYLTESSMTEETNLIFDLPLMNKRTFTTENFSVHCLANTKFIPTEKAFVIAVLGNTMTLYIPISIQV